MKNSNMSDYSYCITVGKSDVGKQRKANEDHGAHFITLNGLVSVVCDGMGGHVGGAIASEVAIIAIHEFLDSQYFEDPREAIGLAIEAANNAIIQRTMIEPELSGMGSTCVLLIVRNAKVYIGHVGDSRIYLIREKKITQLTKDHSFVQMLVDMGEISKEQAEHHPRKNEITNALGLPNMLPATIKAEPITPQAGDCFLLCSDGLSGMVSDHNIEKIVSKQRELRTQERADLLVQTANANGGVDNITVELVEFTVTPGLSKSNCKKIKILSVISLFVFCAVIGVVLWVYKSKPEVRYISWGTVAFEKHKPVFSIGVNHPENKTIVVFNNCRDTIEFLLNSDEQLETNLCVNKSGTSYSLRFDDKHPVNTDSVYVRLSFGKHQYFYSVCLDEPQKELSIIDLQPKTLTAIPYKKENVIATLTFIPRKNYILLSVTNNDEIQVEGELDIKSVKVENAKMKSTSNDDKNVWTIYSAEKKDVKITFVCEEDAVRKKYNYIVPFAETSSVKSNSNPAEPIKSDPPKQKAFDSGIEIIKNLEGEVNKGEDSI